MFNINIYIKGLKLSFALGHSNLRTGPGSTGQNIHTLTPTHVLQGLNLYHVAYSYFFFDRKTLREALRALRCGTQDLNPGWEHSNQWPLPLHREPLRWLILIFDNTFSKFPSIKHCLFSDHRGTICSEL